jgi:ATP-binding cassette subfamily B (MDR/TAP) protein 1
VDGLVRFADVHFAYPNRPELPIFAGFSLTVEAGTVAALVGMSGSGKSTTIQLVERFYDPTSGTVRS